MQARHLITYSLCWICLLAAPLLASQHSLGTPSSHANKATLVASENVVLLRPNTLPSEAMALGNGSLGVAVWSSNGMTVQLNRADTMPYRLSPGQVILPGLSRITNASDYNAHLDLYNGEFVESGGGMSARAYVEPDVDTVVIKITGVPAAMTETAELKLWPPRNPKATVAARYGALAENWIDNIDPGASGLSFGSLAAISGAGRNVHIAVKDARTIQLTLKPDALGCLTIRVSAPAYNGKIPVANALVGKFTANASGVHRTWWHRFWENANLIQASSPDGVAQYMANLRDLYLFYAAAERGTAWPGSQAGIADMLSAVGDNRMWDPAAFWHWNLRMMTAANLNAGLPELNASYFRLYRDNLYAIEAWTHRHMEQRVGICVPETMRFNGLGIEVEESDRSHPAYDCAIDSSPYYNARTLSTGAEISFWIWQQYLATDDLAFLRHNYPVMREASRFLLAYQKPGRDGLLHTSPSNAHETQWDVADPITDLVGMQTLYANTIEAATLLRTDSALIGQLRPTLAKLPPLPRTTADKATILLPPSADATGTDVLTTSYIPAVPQRNVENLGLEPVWPYGLIGSDGPNSAIAKRTFDSRPYPVNQDWSNDPIQAARLGLGANVSSTLATLTEHYQIYPNGLASWGGNSGEFYIEQSGVVADALSEALAQDYDDTIRIGPAVPPRWSMVGSVAIRHRSTVEVKVDDGIVRMAVIHSGTTRELRVKNPWGQASLTIMDGATEHPVQTRNGGNGTLTFSALAGHTYLLHPSESRPLAFELPSAGPATQPRHLGSRMIGLGATSQ